LALCAYYFDRLAAIWICYALIGHVRAMRETRRLAFTSVLVGIVRELHPSQANCRPALFMLEVAAALLSVLALRDGILGSPTVSIETLFAVGLWGTLVAVACGLTIRGA
jgi:hypothetical protein